MAYKLIKKDKKNNSAYFHVFTKEKRICEKIYNHFINITPDIIFFEDPKLNYLFKIIYAAPDDIDINDIKSILKLVERDNLSEKKSISKYIDLPYMIRLYNNRESYIDQVDANINLINNFIQKIEVDFLREIGSLRKFDINDIEEDSEDNSDDEIEINTPIFNNFIYENLPPVLNTALKYIGEDARKKDMFLIALFPTLSLLFNNFRINMVREDNSNEAIKLNMYSFVISGASSGKGVLKYLNDILFRYKKEIQDYNNRKEFELGKKDYIPFVPIIPANVSAAGLKMTLQNNNGLGLIIETEADNLIKNNKSEWGGISEDLRSAFHNETISDLRLGRGITYIENSYISLAMSGTLDQLKKMFYISDSLENGLFSRFLFYYNNESNINYNFFKDSIKYNLKDDDYDNIIKELSNSIYDIHNFYRDIKNIDIIFNADQLDYINKKIRYYHSFIFKKVDNDFNSIFNRSVLSIFKIASILSIIRKGIKKRDIFDMNLDDGFYDGINMSINDIDIEIASNMFGTMIEHAVWIYNGAKKTSESIKEVSAIKVSDPTSSVDYLDILPKNFKRKDLISVLKNNNIIKDDLQVRQHLKKLLNLKLIKKAKLKGYYEKN